MIIELAVVSQMAPKMQAAREKMEKPDFVKFYNFCMSEDTVRRVKPIWNEKIFSSDISDKDLISRIGKELLQFNNKKRTQFKNGQDI